MIRLPRAARLVALSAALLSTTLPDTALAAGLDGRAFGPAWALPFLGILLSIAILPQIAHRFWDRHIGALAGFWAAATLLPLGLAAGWGTTLDAALHILLVDYLPFVILLGALYTIAGGIVVAGNLRGSPGLNTGLLALGTLLAGLVGTTGASMVLIRPLIRANDDRARNAHVVVFFIFLVSNVGGALTPLGDPPLFLGYLRGVDFFWPTRALAGPTAFVAGLLLALFYVIDRRVGRGGAAAPVDPTPETRIRLRGRINLWLLAGLVGTVLACGAWRPGVGVTIRSTTLDLQNLVRDGMIVALALASIALTSRRDRAANDFTWRPIVEVAKIFAGIFVCLLPVAAALAAGRDGAFAPVIGLLSRPDGSPNEVAYFWAAGLLSSVLDNAPTYLVFFEMAGGDAGRLMSPLAGTLAAISSGAVFMGALTYVGNAPNFMVYAVARQHGVRMPGFLGYMLWSGAVLLPVFGLLTLLVIR